MGIKKVVGVSVLAVSLLTGCMGQETTESTETEAEAMVLADNQDTFEIGDTINHGNLNITINNIEKEGSIIKVDVTAENITKETAFLNVSDFSIGEVSSDNANVSIAVPGIDKVNTTLTFDTVSGSAITYDESSIWEMK